MFCLQGIGRCIRRTPRCPDTCQSSLAEAEIRGTFTVHLTLRTAPSGIAMQLRKTSPHDELFTARSGKVGVGLRCYDGATG